MCEGDLHDPLNGSANLYGDKPDTSSRNRNSPAASLYSAALARVSRRNLLKYVTAGAAAVMVAPPVSPRGSFGTAGNAATLGTGTSSVILDRHTIVAGASATPNSVVVTMAMHVHSSFSERTGSMESQLNEARANNVDVLWWTEHDWRMAATCYRTQVSFDSLDSELQFGEPWLWQSTTSGSPTKAGGSIVSTPLSPKDPSAIGALEVNLTSTAPAAHGFFANTYLSRWNHQGNISGMAVTVDVLPGVVLGAGFIEVLLVLSHHTPIGGRHAGIYQISYRFGHIGAQTIGGQVPGSHVVDGLTGIVTQALPGGAYTTVSLDPTADVGKLWPDIDPRDNALSSLYLRAGTDGAGSAKGYFDNMTLSYPDLAARQATQSALMALYGPEFPSVEQIASSEASFFSPHMNVFGADVPRPYGDPQVLFPAEPAAAFYEAWNNSVRASGAVSSLNHVYGTGGFEDLTPAEQASHQTSTITKLIKSKAYGCNVFEAGYRMRGGMSLEAHLAAWDACSRNGIVTTANGTNDDHYGVRDSWATQPNRFLTCVWATSTVAADVLMALSVGRVYVADLTSFGGSIDLALDDGTPMGGITKRGTALSRQLTVMASNMPVNSYFEVVMGPVDFAGPGELAPGTTVVATIPASAIASGSATITVPTTVDSFFRLNLFDPAQTSPSQRIAFSNPIWVVNAVMHNVDAGRITP